MQQIITGPNLQLILNRKNLIALGLLVACLLAAFLGFQRVTQSLPASRPLAAPISTAVLEERYGLKINLVAVTAAGGFVDVRFKIVDAAKAKQLLQKVENYPSLWIAAQGATLSVPADERGVISFQDGSNFNLLFPNSNNAVKQGTPVNLTFGSIQIEGIDAR